MGVDAPERVRALALAAAERALTLDPSAAEAYVIRAIFRGLYNLDWAAAGADFARAIELNPASALAHSRRGTIYLRPLGRLEEALVEHDLAVTLDPLSGIVRFNQAYGSHLLGMTERALSLARTASELFPDYLLGCHQACLIFAGAGAREEAERALRRGMQADAENPLTLASEAVIRGGDPAEAERIRRKLEELAKSRPLPRYLFILLEAARGDYAAAISWIERAIAEGETLLFLLTFRDPFFRELRAHERFPEILRKLNLSA
jgi:tetratricopeptide (TPR) repeat protein